MGEKTVMFKCIFLVTNALPLNAIRSAPRLQCTIQDLKQVWTGTQKTARDVETQTGPRRVLLLYIYFFHYAAAV